MKKMYYEKNSIFICVVVSICFLFSSFTISAAFSDNQRSLYQETSQKQEKEVIGKWKDRWGTYILYKQNNIYYLQNKYIDGSGNIQRMQVRVVNGQRVYNVAGDSQEFAIIRNGNMYWYDSDGNLGLVWQKTN